MKRFISGFMVFVLLLTFFGASFAETSTAAETTNIIDKQELDSLISNLLSEMNILGYDISVAYTYATTGDMYSYNGDHWYKGAGLYNVPLMIMVENGRDTEIVKDIDKRMGLDTVINACLIKSNLSYYTTIQENLYSSFKDYRQAELDLINWTNTSNKNFYYTSEYSTEMMNGYLQLLVNDQIKYADIISAMKDCKNTLYFHNSELANKYTIAQKNGSDESSAHCTGIIFTENPILLTVMASGIRDSFANILFGKLADTIVKYTQEKADPAYIAFVENGGALNSGIDTAEPIPDEIEAQVDPSEVSEEASVLTEAASIEEPTEEITNNEAIEPQIEEPVLNEDPDTASVIDADADTEISPSPDIETYAFITPEKPDVNSRNVSLIIFGALALGSLAIAIIIIILIRSAKDTDDDDDEDYDDDEEDDDDDVETQPSHHDRKSIKKAERAEKRKREKYEKSYDDDDDDDDDEPYMSYREKKAARKAARAEKRERKKAEKYYDDDDDDDEYNIF